MRKKPLDPRDSAHLQALGETIRDSRRGRLSLEELAERAGISAGQLSNLENGTGNPSVEMLIRIARALDLNVTDLVEVQPATHTLVVRASRRRKYRVLDMEKDVHLLSPGIRHQLTVSYNKILPGERRNAERYEGHTLTYVLKGELYIETASATHVVRTHDSLLMPLPYVQYAGSDAPVEFIGVFRAEGR